MEEHPQSVITGIIRGRNLKLIYFFPDYILRDKTDPSKAFIGINVISTKIEEPDRLNEFSKLFLSDVKFTTLIPEMTPNASDRNTVLFISSGEVSLSEWCLFKIKSGWWFMKKWPNPEAKKAEFTAFMKCGEEMGKYLDNLVK